MHKHHHQSFLSLSFYILCLLLSLNIPSLYAKCELPRLKNTTGMPVALVIGNSRYQNGTLKHPVNDATDVASFLKQIGFAVISENNVDYRKMNQLTLQFSQCVEKQKGVALFYFSGHGTQIIERNKIANYLLPIDNANILDDKNVQQKAFPVRTLIDRLFQTKNEINIIILDANRRNPYPRGHKTLATNIQYPGHWLIGYPTDNNQKVIDIDVQKNPFTN